MKKSIGLFLTVCLMAAAAAGCGKQTVNTENPQDLQEAAEQPESDDSKEKKPEIPDAQNQSGDEKKESEEFSFADLKATEFWFASGAGAWSTVLTIGEDGSFSGQYHDSEMGSQGEGYPKGTQYLCDFSGRFAEPVKVGDTIYSLKIAEISCEKEAGTEEIRDEIKYLYSEPYGLEDTDHMLLCLPGTSTKDFSEELADWLSYQVKDDTLLCYGLINEPQERGFVSYNIIDSFQEDLKYSEEWAAQIEESLENDSLDQKQLNEKTAELYQLWDGELNRLWRILNQVKDEGLMKELLPEQRKWIADKEKAVKEAGADYEGGSMQPMIENRKAAEMTKARLYQLYQLLEE